jgi:S1-C subfamily serine protease
MKALLVVAFSAVSLLATAQQTPSAADSQAIFEHTKAATAIIVAGESAGRFVNIATGVIVSKDGEILTAYHAVRSASQAQVRLANGDVFDHVDLLGFDERRDVALLKISAGALPALATGSTATLAQGDPVYAVTSGDGLSWSATEGIFSAVSPADEVPGAGTGFRLLQFTAPVAPGASGGALVDRNGAIIGIITGGKRAAGFAVPIENVLGLHDQGPKRIYGSGASLLMPSEQAAEAAQSSASIASADPKQILKNAKTIYIRSKTAFLTVDTLDRALAQQKDWDKLGLTIVQEPSVADLLIELDRPLFTYGHTFVIIDKKTSIVLGSGKVTAFDGTIASGGLAKDIVKIFTAARASAPPKK